MSADLHPALVSGGVLRAILMVGGKGMRLMPHTEHRPKALLRLGDLSILDVVVERLRQAGVDRITMCISHLGEQIQREFGSGRRSGIRIDYSADPRPMGTAAPLLLIDDWEEPALVMNGDVLTTIDFAGLYRAHRLSGDPLTVASYRHRVPIDFGVLDIVDGHVAAIREKPDMECDVSSGIYVADPSIRAHIRRGRPVDMPEVITALIRGGSSVNAYRFSDQWHDIGNPQSYELVQRTFRENPGLFLTGGPRDVNVDLGRGPWGRDATASGLAVAAEGKGCAMNRSQPDEWHAHE
jgi:NDP-sugar pyrophosphorylase family protein